MSELNFELAFDTVELELGGSVRNVSCSGEMHRYDIEHQ